MTGQFLADGVKHNLPYDKSENSDPNLQALESRCRRL